MASFSIIFLTIQFSFSETSFKLMKIIYYEGLKSSQINQEEIEN